uniref:Uncharacterized protein n=1 Tax=Meloidogyne hapla TaxID=6305 RepID=A0A1I8BM48_MELHA
MNVGEGSSSSAGGIDYFGSNVASSSRNPNDLEQNTSKWYNSIDELIANFYDIFNENEIADSKREILKIKQEEFNILKEIEENNENIKKYILNLMNFRYKINENILKFERKIITGLENSEEINENIKNILNKINEYLNNKLNILFIHANVGGLTEDLFKKQLVKQQKTIEELKEENWENLIRANLMMNLNEKKMFDEFFEEIEKVRIESSTITNKYLKYEEYHNVS